MAASLRISSSQSSRRSAASRKPLALSISRRALLMSFVMVNRGQNISFSSLVMY